MGLGIRTTFQIGVAALALSTPSDTSHPPAAPTAPLPHSAPIDLPPVSIPPVNPPPLAHAPPIVDRPEIEGLPECDRWVFRGKVIEWAKLARSEDVAGIDVFKASALVGEFETTFKEDPRYKDELRRMVLERGEAGDSAAFLLAGRLRESSPWGVSYLLEVTSRPVSSTYALYGGPQSQPLPPIPASLAAHEKAYNSSYPARPIETAYRDLKTIFPLLTPEERTEAAAFIRQMLIVHNLPERESGFAARPTPYVQDARLREMTKGDDPERILNAALTLNSPGIGRALERIHFRIVNTYLGDVRAVVASSLGDGRSEAAKLSLIGVVNDHGFARETRLRAIAYLQDGNYSVEFKRLNKGPIHSLATTLVETQEPLLQEALIEFFVKENLFQSLGESCADWDGVLNVLVEVANRDGSPAAIDARIGISLVCTSEARGGARGPLAAETYLMSALLRGDRGAEEGVLIGLSSPGDEDAREYFRNAVLEAVASRQANVKVCAEVVEAVFGYLNPAQAEIIVGKLIPEVMAWPHNPRFDSPLETLLGKFAHFGDPDEDRFQSSAQLKVARTAVIALIRNDRFPDSFARRGLDERTWDGLVVEKRDFEGLLKYTEKSHDLYGFAWLARHPEFKNELPKTLASWGPATVRWVRPVDEAAFGFIKSSEVLDWLSAVNSYLTDTRRTRTVAEVASIRSVLQSVDATIQAHDRLVRDNQNRSEITRIGAPRELQSVREVLPQLRRALSNAGRR